MHVSLYIGHHKVGSTSLQVFLSQNVVRLIRHGILYPYTEMQGAASVAARMLSGDRGSALTANIREPHSALAYQFMSEAADFPIPRQFTLLPPRQQMIRAIRMQVSELKPRAVILCSEAFANFGAVKPDLIDAVTRIFPDATFSVYGALRRPDEYLASWHNQRVKVGERAGLLAGEGWRHYEATIHFNYRLAVEDWLIRVPGEAKVLRNYADILTAGGSEADFMTHSGIDFPDGMTPARRANKSLHPALVEIARQGNHALTLPEAHALVQFLMKHQAALDLPPASDIELFGTQSRRAMFEAFLPSHAWLSGITGQAAFFPDIDAMLTCRPLPEAEAMRAALAALSDDKIATLQARPRDFLAHLRATPNPAEV